MSRVAIVGPGRVGTLLAVGLTRAGHRVVAVAGGSESSRDRVATLVAGARPLPSPSAAAELAELVMLTVPDDALDEVVTDLARTGAVGEGHHVVHVAGSRGLGALRRAAMAGARVAACHPAMTVPRESTDPDLLVGTAWAVTANASDRAWAHELVTELGGDPHDLPDDRRALYHAGLAVGSNAVGAAVAAARQLLIAAKVDDPSAFLQPLVDASVGNVLQGGAAALTGPVARGDVGTVAAHLAALARDLPELDEVYRSLARATLAIARAGLEPEVADRLAAMFADPPGIDGPPAPSDPTTAGTNHPLAPPSAAPGRDLPMHPES